MSAAIAPWNFKDFKAWLRLSLTPSVGHRTALRLLKQFGHPESVFRASVDALKQCANASQVQKLSEHPPQFSEHLATAWQWLNASSAECVHALITLGDPRYPPSLLQIPDPPLMLYVIGAAQWLSQPLPLCDWQSSLAIVGSRNPTPQGTDNAYQFAHYLAKQGWCVVSGMANGIDTAAHKGALAAQTTSLRLTTIAVVGTGVDRIYPRANQQLARQLTQHGLIISEFPLGTPPIASNFPKRNRIISGLTRGTLVVEAAIASGSLITAKTASEQGREVFAIPGSIHNPLARGCHTLIQQGAKLVQHAQDILEEFDFTTPPRQATDTDPPQQEHTSAIADPLLQVMGYDPVHLDHLCARSGLSTATVQAQLLELELAGKVMRLPGQCFQRSSQA